MEKVARNVIEDFFEQSKVEINMAPITNLTLAPRLFKFWGR